MNVEIKCCVVAEIPKWVEGNKVDIWVNQVNLPSASTRFNLCHLFSKLDPFSLFSSWVVDGYVILR